jgi:hypothetical protein
VIDTDGSGTLSADEFLCVLQHQSDDSSNLLGLAIAAMGLNTEAPDMTLTEFTG